MDKFMNTSNILPYNTGSYARLSSADITRLPKMATAPNPQKTLTDTNEIKKTTKIAKIFTVVLSALVGLYIAHRNNLFSPVMKETKKVLKTPDTFEKINKYVNDNFNFETCAKVAKKFLNNFDSSQPEALSQQAKILAADNKKFDNLAKKVFSELSDDNNAERFKRGLCVDMMDLYLPKIEKKLQTLKDNNQPYKKLQPEIVADLFKKDSAGVMPIEDLFYNAIKGRIKNTIIDSVQKERTLALV